MIRLYAIAQTAIKVTQTGIRLMTGTGVVFASSDDEAKAQATNDCLNKFPDCTNHDAIVSRIPAKLLRQAIAAYD